MTGLKQFPEYRPSGVDWLGDIPAHWKMVKLKNGFDLHKRPPIKSAGIVTAFRDGQVTLRSNRRIDGYTEGDKQIGYQTIHPGDLVIHAMDAFAGAIGVSDSLGQSTPVYSACTPKSGFNAHFYARALRHIALTGYISALAKGVRERSTDFRWADAKELPVPQPPIEEQNNIVSFLDRETGQIDDLIAKQDRLAALLTEKRQAIITHAVTKGLDPTEPTKPSGIPWLGEIGRTFEPIQLGRLTRKVADGPHFSPQYVDDGGVMFLSARNIRVDSWSLTDAKFISESDYEEFSKRIVPEKGDVLYTKGGTTGIARVVDLDQKFQVWVHVAVLKVRRDLADPHYVAYALNSHGGYDQSQLHTRGATNQDLGLTRMIRIWVALPDLVQQKRIVRDLDSRTNKIDKLIEKAISTIVLLRERRSALISAAVTGKIDVRERAA
ncbi:restriction endonuclease subunit S [Arthrobacter sp. NPDC056886]|uniref:restriction endonuclease subunit S n=1 Tax=Arthrobacter sp. NPDC056886 TaxID=3345960 RepID=UPI00366AA21E